MDEKDAEKFAGLYGRGELLKPEQPGNVIARLALDAHKEIGGKFLRFVIYNSRNLSWNVTANACIAGTTKS